MEKHIKPKLTKELEKNGFVIEYQSTPPEFFKLYWYSIKFEEFFLVPYNYFIAAGYEIIRFGISTDKSIICESILEFDEEFCKLESFDVVMLRDLYLRVRGFHINGAFYLHENIIEEYLYRRKYKRKRL